MATNNNSSILDVVSGRESVKVDISLTTTSILYLLAAAVLVGVILMVIKKKVVK